MNMENKKHTETVVINSGSQNGLINMLPIDEMRNWYMQMIEFGREILKENLDYGIIPGIEKPTLLKPGAEKLKTAFGLQVESLECVRDRTDFEKKYIDVTYRCIITSRSGVRLGICQGNANSFEPKFRYAYLPTKRYPSKDEADILKVEGKGKWKKIKDRWVWFEKKENPDILGLKNNIEKMAQKRAFVGAVLMATGASEFFTQDMEDFFETGFALLQKNSAGNKNGNLELNPEKIFSDMQNSKSQEELNRIFFANSEISNINTFVKLYEDKSREFLNSINAEKIKSDKEKN